MRPHLLALPLTLVLAGCAGTAGQQAAGPAPSGNNQPPTTTAPPSTPPPTTPPPTTPPPTTPPPTTPTDDSTEGDPADPGAGEFEPTEEDLEEPESPELKFGQTYTYTDGLSITISKPQPFRPSDTAAVTRSNAYRQFTVTIVNKTGRRYDPSGFSTTVQSANEEAEQIFDSARGIGGSPDTTLLKNREAKFRIAYSLADPKDIVMEVSPDFGEYENAIYTTG